MRRWRTWAASVRGSAMIGCLQAEHPDAGMRNHNMEPDLVLTGSTSAQGLTNMFAQ